MKIRVRYFAAVKESVGHDAEELDVPASVSTVAGLRAFLRERGGAYEGVFSEKRLVRSALNQDMVQPTAQIKAGDEVAFFPPVTGG